MKDFKSPFLAALSLKKTNRFVRIFVRATLLALLVIPVLVWLILVIFQPLDKHGLGYWPYWLHDYIFLPLKGYTYTLYYPNSLAWWGFIAIVVIVWLASFLSDTSFIQPPHVRLLRRLVGQEICHGALLLIPRLLRYHWFEPRLLIAVTEHERILALHKLNEALPTSTECARLAHLTYLLMELQLLPRPSLFGRMAAAVYWQQTWLALRRHSCPQKAIATMAGRLNTLLHSISMTQSDATLTRSIPFEPGVISRDLIWLTRLTNANLNGSTRHPSIGIQSSAERLYILSRLADSIQRRQSILNRVRYQLERLVLAPSTDLQSLEPITEVQGLPALDEAVLRMLGQLSVGIALDLALHDITALPLALSYLDSLEALSLVLECAGSEVLVLGTDLTSRLSALLANVPSQADYELSASLASIGLTKYQEAWRKSLQPNQDLISEADFNLAETRVASLAQAAGPTISGEEA